MLPTKFFEGKHIVVGISGCIAAYKSCELIRYLVSQGAEVRVAMTPSATKFISPLTLETLSGHPVFLEMFPENGFTGTHHIHLADWADAAIIAPATANILAKAANGIADDFLSTLLLALHGPVVYAPAMNTHMWLNKVVQRNVEKLQSLANVDICPPEEGFLAEGYTGIGRLARLDSLVQFLYRAMHPRRDSMQERTVLVSAGPTQEPIDPVRYISNRSSGKMGLALAVEAFARGANVILVHGPISLEISAQIHPLPIQTAREMQRVVEEQFKFADVFLSAAAVSDFRPKDYQSQKIKKKNEVLTIRLEPNPDILKEMGQSKRPEQKVIGFALETDAPEANAARKLKEKNLDGIVLNVACQPGETIGSDFNQVTLLKPDGSKKRIGRSFKLDVAREIIDFFFS